LFSETFSEKRAEKKDLIRKMTDIQRMVVKEGNKESRRLFGRVGKLKIESSPSDGEI